MASFEPTKFLRSDNHDLISTVYRYMLRPIAADFPHQFAKARFRILQKPMP